MSITSFPQQIALNGQSLGVGDLTTDAWGVQKVSFPFSLFNAVFTFDIPPAVWLMYENGAEVSTSTKIIATGGSSQITADAVSTTTMLVSRETPRYQANRGHLFSIAAWLPNKTNNGVRDFGLFTNENGIFFRLKADGLLYAVLKSNNVETHEQVIDTSVLSIFDVEKNNIYDIQYQWRSAGDYKFFIGDPAEGASKLVHQINLLGTMTNTSLENPALPTAFKCTRITQDVVINLPCVDITSENGKDDLERYGSSYAENVTVNGTNVPVLIIREPLLISGKTNTRDARLERISVTCSKKATFKVWITRNAAAITGATFQPIGNGIYVETDSPDMVAGAVRATSVNTALMRFVNAVPVEAAVRAVITNPNPDHISFHIVRGDYLVITCTATTATADVVAEWGDHV